MRAIYTIDRVNSGANYEALSRAIEAIAREYGYSVRVEYVVADMPDVEYDPSDGSVKGVRG